MPNRDLPPELILRILFFLEPYTGPESGFRRGHIVLQKMLVKWMCLSRTHYQIAQPLLYHTITSAQLNSAMERVRFRATQCSHIASLVRVLYANYNESRAMTPFPGLPSLPIVMFQAGVCNNLQVLVLSRTTYPRLVLPARLLRDRSTLAPGWPASPNYHLANLCRFEIHPDEWLRDDLDLESDGWLLLLAKLPQMETISVPTITRRALAPPQEQAQPQEQPLNTKSLALTSQPLSPELLEAVLKTFPLLEKLSVTWPERGNIWPTAADIWPQLGDVLREHGLSLRTIHIEWKRAPRGFQIDLARLSGLHSLALPIEAVTSAGADLFSIPLDSLLPSNIRSLTITDHRNLQADAFHLDNQLRNLMVHRTFSELRSIRLRRNIPFIQSGGLGWLKRSPDQFWQVLERK